MKLPLWTAALPILAVCITFEAAFDLGEQGRLDSTFLREKIYPIARSVIGTATNIKFKLRGEEKPKQKIIVLAADDRSIQHLGRWPWHRELYANLIYSTFKLGARYLGIDTVFSEPENRIPQEIYSLIQNKKIINEIKTFEGDPLLAEVIHRFRDRVVLGYTPQGYCQPRYDPPESCPLNDSDLNREIHNDLSKFSQSFSAPIESNQITKTPLLNLFSTISNIPILRDAANHAGFFFVSPDPDGYIRRYPLIFMHGQRVYLSLALKLAELVKQDTVQVDFSPDARISKVHFKNTPDAPLPTTPLGYLDLNFRGKSETFTYVSVLDLLRAAEIGNPEIKNLIQDSIVIFGATALGVYDMRAFPFDSNTAGVEGHATALDNILSQDALQSATSIHLSWIPLLLLILFGIAFAIAFSKLEAIPSLFIFIGFSSLLGIIDIKILFSNQINLPTAFLLIETFAIFAFLQSIRFVLEEKNKKFIRATFSRYLAPQIVDHVLKDSSKLAIGGERRELSILFSDLRGFTTISETMDPKTLSQFLNEYLTEMTEIVFKYNGTLDKYIGDALMAFWGAPIEQKDHAFQALSAGIEMQKKIKEITPYFKNKYKVDLGAGIGINSGIVSVGNMGSERIFEYTVIGDHVNLASRLEGLTRFYGVDLLCTQNTLNCISPEDRTKIFSRPIDSVKVKGKKDSTLLIQVASIPFDSEKQSRFEAAKRLFQNRQWKEASELFSQDQETDPVCRFFLERCSYFKNDPPPVDWDGSTQMREK